MTSFSLPVSAWQSPPGRFPSGGLELSGTADYFGTAARFRLQVAADGRFRREITGPLPELQVFDGRELWQVDDAGVPYRVALFLRELALAEAALISGRWAERDGSAFGTLERDSDGRPRSWRAPNFAGAAGLDFADWRAVEGLLLAHRITELTPTGSVNRYQVEQVRPLAAAEFAPPVRTAGDVRWLDEVPAEVPMRRAASGHLFVRPRVQGRELGWFVFDTGAAISVIGAEAAAQLGLEPVGTSNILGAGAGVQAAVLKRGGALELGPLHLASLVWTELPAGHALEQLSQLLGGEPIAGILGWDVLIRATAELDLVGGRLWLHDPARYLLPAGADWEPMLLHRRHPFLRARYAGDREGWFCLDSGAGTLSVCFHTETVQKERLLDGRETQDVQAFGAGGALNLKIGTLDWFEVAGRRHERPTVAFSMDPSGALADTWSAGTMGHPFFADCVLALDYAGGRVGLIPKADSGH